MTIPGELRNRVCDFVFEITHKLDNNPANLSNRHLSNHFNLLLCSRQLRHEFYEKIFEVERFFQDFEALDAWISRGTVMGPELLLRVCQVGIQMGRMKKRPDCNAAYEEFRVQEAFSRLPSLRTLRISSTYTLGSFVMNNQEVAEIMTSICKACPSLERLAFLVPCENLNFLHGLSNLSFLAITTPTFFDADHFLSVMQSLPSLKRLRVRDRSCSSSFTPFILSHMPMLKELQLRNDTATGQLIIPEMMEALVRRHGNSINSVHLEASSFSKEGTLEAIITSLPKLLHLSTLKLWFDLNRQANEFLEEFVVTLPLLPKLTDLHICFRPPRFSNPKQIWQKIMESLSTGATDIRSGGLLFE
jgi:hypothetical protein